MESKITTSGLSGVKVRTMQGDAPPLNERVAKLEADMAWVKKLVIANVTISTLSLISIILTIVMIAIK